MKPNSFQIRSTPLSLWLPLIVALGILLIIALYSLIEIQDELQRVQRGATRTIQLTASQLTAPIRRALETGEKDNLKALISSLVLHDQIDLALLADEQFHIMESSRYALIGQPLTDLYDPLPPLQPLQQTPVQILPGQHGLLGIINIPYLPAGSDRQGMRNASLWLEVDTKRSRNQVIAEAVERLLPTSLLGLLILTGLLLWLRRHVTRPLNQLAAANEYLAQGDLDLLLQVDDRGEIARLATSMQAMVNQIRDTIHALQTSEERLSVTLDSIGDAVLVTDIHGLVTRLNPSAEALTGWKESEALGRPVIEVFHIVNAETREPAEHPVGRVLREGVVVGLANHTTLISRTGEEYQIADSAAPIRDDNGQTLGVIMVFQDVTEQYRMESELHQVHQRLQAILQSLPDPCFILDAEGQYLEVLGGMDELLPANRSQLLHKRVAEILPKEEAAPILTTIHKTLKTGQTLRLEYTISTLSGKRHFEGSVAPIPLEENKQGVIWLARDKTDQKAAEKQLHHLAFFDALTGLANRKMMNQHIRQALGRSQRLHYHSALIFIDIDQFKDINDSLGHSAGDQALCHVAHQIRETIRIGDLAARFGGDEFVVIVEDLGSTLAEASVHAEQIASKIRNQLQHPLSLDGTEHYISISQGITLFPQSGHEAATLDAEALLKQADMAMFKAKQAGPNQIRFFAAEMQHAAETRLKLQRELHHALQEEQFRLYVQPQADAQGRWISGEVLIRWQHPERGLVMPGTFIPAAEKIGLIEDIDHWVIQQTIARLGQEQKHLPDCFENLSFNITAALLLQEDFPDQLQQWLMEAGVDPQRIELEITERVLLDDQQKAADVMQQLRQLGVRFSIDDFGTGYSSLRYLQQLPIDTLKIDKSFIDRLPQHPGDSSIVTTIIDMAQHLGLGIIAEGVETEQQLQFLQQKGCQQFQGYYFAKPMPWESFFSRFSAD